MRNDDSIVSPFPCLKHLLTLLPNYPWGPWIWRRGRRRGFPGSDVVVGCWLCSKLTLSFEGDGALSGFFQVTSTGNVSYYLGHPTPWVFKDSLTQMFPVGVTLSRQPNVGPLVLWECSYDQAPNSREHMSSFLSSPPWACLPWLKVRSKYPWGSNGREGGAEKVVKWGNLPHSNHSLQRNPLSWPPPVFL